MEFRNRGQRETQSLEAWETWVDHLIVEAQERGEFDDLPGHGKPLQIDDAPFAGGLEVGFGILKNAGIAPYWVELEKEMRATTERLEAIERRATELATSRSAHEPERAAGGDPESNRRRRGWRPFRRATQPWRAAPKAEPHATDLAWLRREYLELTEHLDRTVAQYNAAIPRDLWRLERPRLPRDAAAASFDALVREATAGTRPDRTDRATGDDQAWHEGVNRSFRSTPGDDGPHVSAAGVGHVTGGTRGRNNDH